MNPHFPQNCSVVIEDIEEITNYVFVFPPKPFLFTIVNELQIWF